MIYPYTPGKLTAKVKVAVVLDSQTLWQVDRLAFSDSARLAFGFWYGGAASTIRAGGDIGEAKGGSARGRRDEAGEEGEGQMTVPSGITAFLGITTMPSRM